MITFPYTEEDVEKLSQVIVNTSQALHHLTEDPQGQQLSVAVQHLAKALHEFPSQIFPGDTYVRLTNLLHVLTNLRKEAEWSDKLSFGELSGIADQLVQIIHEAVAHHEIFKEIAMPSLAYLQKRDILAVEADPEKQIALFPQYDEETQGAFAQYEKINDISEQKNVEMAAIAEELKKSKFSGQAPAEETIIKAVLGMVELYAVFAAAAIAGDIVTTLHAYRGASIERIEHKLLGEDDANLYEK